MKNYLDALWTKVLNLFKKTEPAIVADETPNMLFNRLGVDEISILIGSDLADFGYDIVYMVKKIRLEIKKENGFILPAIKTMDDTTLQENEYRILVRGNIKFVGFAIPNKEYALSEIKNSLYKVYEENLYDIFSTSAVEKYISYLDSENSILKYTIMEFFTITSIKQIFVYLIMNGQSINDIVYIFEKMCEYASTERDKYLYRNPMPIAQSILDDLNQNNRNSEKEECILKY